MIHAYTEVLEKQQPWTDAMAEVLSRRSTLFFVLGRYEDALQDAVRCLHLDPKYTAVRRRSPVCLVQRPLRSPRAPFTLVPACVLCVLCVCCVRRATTGWAPRTLPSGTSRTLRTPFCWVCRCPRVIQTCGERWQWPKKRTAKPLRWGRTWVPSQWTLSRPCKLHIKQPKSVPKKYFRAQFGPVADGCVDVVCVCVYCLQRNTPNTALLNIEVSFDLCVFV